MCVCVCVCVFVCLGGGSKKGKQMGKKIIWVDFCFGFFFKRHLETCDCKKDN